MMLVKAVQFASQKHKGQVRRGSGLPYIIHPTSVAFILSMHKSSKCMEELLTVCLLHDTLEDTDACFSEIAEEFSPLVASLVLELTSDQEQIDLVGKNEYLITKMSGMSNYGLVIKLADRLANILDAPSPSYCEDTLEMMNRLEIKRRLTESQQSIVIKIREVLQTPPEVSA